MTKHRSQRARTRIYTTADKTILAINNNGILNYTMHAYTAKISYNSNIIIINENISSL